MTQLRRNSDAIDRRAPNWHQLTLSLGSAGAGENKKFALTMKTIWCIISVWLKTLGKLGGQKKKSGPFLGFGTQDSMV